MFHLIGRYAYFKTQRRLRDSGDTQAVARQLRKQGYPLGIALLLIVGRT